MMHPSDVQDWLTAYYPGLYLRQSPRGDWAVWQADDTIQAFEIEDRETGETMTIGHVVRGYGVIFPIRGRIPGGWVCDDVQRRDPRLWQNEGNFYHEAYLASKQAEIEKEKRDKAHKESAASMWKAIRKNDGLMNRIAYKMEKGDLNGACDELSPEGLFRAAALANPKEMRSRDFHRAVNDIGPKAI
jgi:hypothetical protein